MSISMSVWVSLETPLCKNAREVPRLSHPAFGAAEITGTGA